MVRRAIEGYRLIALLLAGLDQAFDRLSLSQIRQSVQPDGKEENDVGFSHLQPRST
jgi:hypothetical protein